MWQKRLSPFLALALYAGAALAAPATAPVPRSEPVVVVKPEVLIKPVVLFKKDLALNTVYAWERWGNFINAVPGDGKEIPYDAAKLTVRVYTLPSGEIRVIDFRGGVRTHPHVNMTDTVLYTWTGRRVQFANSQAALNGPGDAALHPKGVFHHGEALETGKGIEFVAFVARQRPDPQVTWTTAASRPMQPMVAWLEGEATYREAIEGTGAGTVAGAGSGIPAGAARFEARSFEFPPYLTREYRIAKGTTVPLDSRSDQLVFVSSGRAGVSTGGKRYELGAEDAAQVRAGSPFLLQALEDLVVVTSSIPPGTPPPPAFR